MIQTEQKRLVDIDILRLLACFLVILTHSALPSVDGTDGLVKGGISLLCSPASELFLALSGAVLLPVRRSMRDFYNKRFQKLIPPVVIWSIISLIVFVAHDNMSMSQAVSAFIQMPLKPVIGPFWFVYVMIGLYLLAPIISPWLMKASKRQVEFILCLWGFNLLLPYLNNFTPPLYTTN